MKALLMKDYVSVAGQLKIYLVLPLMAGFFAYQNHSLSFMQFILSMVVIFVPMSAFAYDDACGFQGYALTIPLTRKDLVLSRYVLCALTGLGVVVVSVLGAWIMTAMLGNDYFIDFEWKSYLIGEVAIFAALNAVNCLLLPLVYKFGTEKARIFLMIIFLAFGALIYIFPDGIEQLDTLSNTTLLWGSIVIAIVLEAVSILISNKIMDTKEF